MVYPIFNRTVLALFRSFVKETKGLEQLPKTGGFILAANHQGLVDYFFLGSVIVNYFDSKIHFISRPEPWWKLLGKRVSNWLGRIEIDPENKSQCLVEATKILQQGGIISIFPEGRAAKGQNLNPGKSGVIRLAQMAKIPIYPVGLKAPQSDQGFIGTMRNIFTAYKKVEIKIGTAHWVNLSDNYSKQGLEKEIRIVMKKIAQLAEKYYPY